MKIEFLREIEAPKETVWQVITDFSAYADWNPFVIRCAAALEPGSPIQMRVVLGGNTRDQTEVVSEVVPNSLFEYRMKPVGPLLYSYRQHEVVSSGEGKTLYRSTFELKGWMSPLVALSMGSSLRDGFQGMTDSLVSRAEALVQR